MSSCWRSCARSRAGSGRPHLRSWKRPERRSVGARVATAIAGLEFDSAVDDDDLARVRDGGPERRLRFRCPNHVVELTVAENNRALAGRVDPPFAGTVVLRHPDGVWLSAAVNQLGQFFFDAVPRGSVSLRPVTTDGALPTSKPNG